MEEGMEERLLEQMMTVWENHWEHERPVEEDPSDRTRVAGRDARRGLSEVAASDGGLLCSKAGFPETVTSAQEVLTGQTRIASAVHL